MHHAFRYISLSSVHDDDLTRNILMRCFVEDVTHHGNFFLSRIVRVLLGDNLPSIGELGSWNNRKI